MPRSKDWGPGFVPARDGGPPSLTEILIVVGAILIGLMLITGICK